MPFYDLKCPCDHIEEDVYTLYDKIKELTCPVCGEKSLKVIIRAPHFKILGPEDGKYTIASKKDLGWHRNADEWWGQDGKST
jgi:putative FmdB family regulatory protein